MTKHGITLERVQSERKKLRDIYDRFFRGLSELV